MAAPLAPSPSSKDLPVPEFDEIVSHGESASSPAPAADRTKGPLVNPLVMFAHALQSTQPLATAVTQGDAAVPQEQAVQPFAIAGRAKQCDIVLPDNTVSQRHLMLQSFRDQVFAIDLFSANGSGITRPGKDRRRFHAGWVSPDAALTIGPYTLQTNATAGAEQQPIESADGLPPSPLDFKPRNHQSEFYGPLPKVDLELTLAGRSDSRTWPINRVMTLLGRHDQCRITCPDESVSAVHCALVLTPAGLWVVDAITRTGTHINGERIRCGLLAEGHELEIGRYKLKAIYDRSDMPVVDTAPAPPPAPAASPATQASQTVAFKTKNHRVFKASPQAPVLIVRPQGDIQEFRYQDVQLESNALIAALSTADFPHVVIDFSDVQVVKSVMLEAVAGICRAAKGGAVFCCASPEMYSSLVDTKLHTLWLHYTSLEDAVTAVTFPQA